MTSRDFAYFLQGFFELSNPKFLTVDQLELIKKHLALVFKHEIDPTAGNKEHQDDLNRIHNTPMPPSFLPHVISPACPVLYNPPPTSPGPTDINITIPYIDSPGPGIPPQTTTISENINNPGLGVHNPSEVYRC